MSLRFIENHSNQDIVSHYHDVMESDMIKRMYPNLQKFMDDDNEFLLIKDEENGLVVNPLIKEATTIDTQPYIDDMAMTITCQDNHIYENINGAIANYENMNKETKLMFKHLFCILLVKAKLDRSRKGDDYYHTNSMSYYRREDLIQELSIIMFGRIYDELKYVMDKYSVLEMTRIYLEEGYFMGGYDKNNTLVGKMNFSIKNDEFRGAYETSIPLKEPILKVEYNDGDVKTVQYHGNYELAYRNDVL